MVTVKENLDHINERIARACERSQRSREEIQVIAVTKYVSISRMEEAYHAGITHFGENRIQDAKEKWEVFGERITWHFIGHLQTNKVKEVIPRFPYIHSLDRIRLADEIAKISARLHKRPPKCFIQVNVSGETSKYGIEPENLFDLAKGIRSTNQIDVVGLMTMAPLVKDPEDTRKFFRHLRQLQQALLDKGWPGIEPKFLSMGMSNDFEIAIEEGATHVRIGTALVGEE